MKKDKFSPGRRSLILSGLLGAAALLVDKWLKPLKGGRGKADPEGREAMFYRVENDVINPNNHQD